MAEYENLHMLFIHILEHLNKTKINRHVFLPDTVVKITKLSNIKDWKHVKKKTQVNADIISRGLGTRNFVENVICFNGSEFYITNREY